MAAHRPALVGTDVCVDLALGRPEAVAFFKAPPVEIRLSTITYLTLLAEARSREEARRIQRFVAPYPVLSLGPMASSSAVELILDPSVGGGLSPLDALVAATALAHEIPLYTRDPVFDGIEGLEVVAPY
jgi:predicted nucleic acid-binding protein